MSDLERVAEMLRKVWLKEFSGRFGYGCDPLPMCNANERTVDVYEDICPECGSHVRDEIVSTRTSLVRYMFRPINTTKEDWSWFLARQSGVPEWQLWDITDRYNVPLLVGFKPHPFQAFESPPDRYKFLPIHVGKREGDT